MDKDAPVGYLNEYLWLVTNDPQTKTDPRPVEGQVQADISVSPASLFLGVLQPGQSVTKQIVVRGQKPFRITSIRADCECLQATAPKDQEPKSLYLVPVTFTAREQNGEDHTNRPYRDGFRSDSSQGARLRGCWRIIGTRSTSPIHSSIALS